MPERFTGICTRYTGALNPTLLHGIVGIARMPRAALETPDMRISFGATPGAMSVRIGIVGGFMCAGSTYGVIFRSIMIAGGCRCHTTRWVMSMYDVSL